ncbi:RecA-like DNA recombinase [Gordonia phage Pons]|uniref:RecA-like DNA recombinase n=2 Tax=Ponsvirus TaxID=3044795 RepID=A0AAE9C281_9CAUD|nr:RecA-like DNA recombinase [Gordonia phage Pons]YP_010663461.1 RecA-like DNA recombinase [Gordonia phage Vine]QZD97753.1 RecA-like DNA recombinase [Gordonia phage Vine]UDL15203.1 RecA-like DNA recombinase [Gordonia phage Pons]WNN94175.1 ASCE ATPase [Gordonia phage Elinal]
MAVTRASTSKDYAAIAKAKIHKPSDPQARRRWPNIFVYGRNKKGKTRFCTTAPKVLILDPSTEDGTKEFTKANPDVWTIEQWSDFNEVYRYIRTGDHDYDYIAFDGLTRFCNMALHFVRETSEEHDLSRQPGMVQQRDYGKANEIMKAMLHNFQNLPCGKIYTAQERMIEAGDGEEDEDAESTMVQYVADLPKGIRSTVNGLVDVIGRIYVVKDDEDKIVRRLWLESSAVYDTGYRSEYVLPQYLSNPTVPRLIRAVKTGDPNPRKKA